jgi:hypothetical protein
VKALCRCKELLHVDFTRTRSYACGTSAQGGRPADGNRTPPIPLSADLKVQRSRFFPFPSSGIERSPKLPSGRDSVEGTAIFTAEKFRLPAELRL